MRLALRDQRAKLSADDLAAASRAVVARLLSQPQVRKATIISGYRAVRGEIDIDTALLRLRDGGATVTVPRVAGEGMEFLPWIPDLVAAPGSFGIQEPVGGEPIPFRRHDVALVPLVAFDVTGQRLGQGGGFYDRAIARAGADRPQLIGIAHSFQQVDEVPTEPWDQRLDAVITEEQVMEFASGHIDTFPSPSE